MLEESDFNDTLVNPMENKEEIVIEVYIENYSNNFYGILCIWSYLIIPWIAGSSESVFCFWT